MIKRVSHIQSEQTALKPAFSAEVAKVLLTEDVDRRFVEMIDEYKMTPFDDVRIVGSDVIRRYSLELKRKIYEKYFGIHFFQFKTSFYTNESIPNLKVPMCVMTVMVMTDSGEYLPWFSRHGMAKINSEHSDGDFADAAVSAERRIFAALGLGGEDGLSEVVFDERPKLVAKIKEHLKETKRVISDLIFETNRAIDEGRLMRRKIEVNKYKLLEEIDDMESLRALAVMVRLKNEEEQVEDVA